MRTDNIKICTEMFSSWSVRLVEQLKAANRDSEARLIELYTEQALDVAAIVIGEKQHIGTPNPPITPDTSPNRAQSLVDTLRAWRKTTD
jgi:hypothetical protein